MFDGPGSRSRCALAVGAAVPLLVIACSSAIREGDASRKFMTTRVPTRAELVGRWARTRLEVEGQPSPSPAKADNSPQLGQQMQFEILPETLALKADSSSQFYPFPLGVLLGRWRFTGDTLAIRWHSIKTSTRGTAPVQGFRPTEVKARLGGDKLVLRLLPDSSKVEAVYERVDSSTGPKAP